MIAIISDNLTTRSAIKEAVKGAGETPLTVKADNVAEITSARKIILDLETQKIDWRTLLATDSTLASKCVAFYPHVRTELAQDAVALGITDISVRSKFFGSLSTITL